MLEAQRFPAIKEILHGTTVMKCDHRCRVRMGVLVDIGGKLTVHSDLAPCDFFRHLQCLSMNCKEKLTDADIEEATVVTPCRMSGNHLLYVFEKWVECFKN